MDDIEVNAGRFAIHDGRLFTTIGDLTNEGELEVGTDSVFTVTGNFIQTDDALLSIILSEFAFGTLDADGYAYLNGELTVDLLDGYAPQLGDSFAILTAASILGTFDDYDLPALPGSLAFEIEYTGTAVTLSVVPEPATCALAVAVAMLMCRRTAGAKC